MISDVLWQAVKEIDEYLDDPLYARIYGGELRERIVVLRDGMKALQVELDTPPSLVEAIETTA
jgi:hypothetical protein